VREYATPATLAAPSTGSLTDDVVRHVERDPDRVLFRREQAGQWREVSAQQFHTEVVAVAKGLLASGVGAGDRVGLLARTRFEWTVVDYACWWVGAATVPAYPSWAPEQVAATFAACGAMVCVVETAQQAAELRRADEAGPVLRRVWAIDDAGLDALALAGLAVTDSVLEERRAAVDPADLATIAFTSGTSESPRGCRLTHGNFLAGLGEATAALPQLFDDAHSCTLLFPPLAHILARTVQVACVHSGTALGHCSDIAELARTVSGFRPTFVVGVPEVFEQIYNDASQRAQLVGRDRVFDAASATAIAYSRALDAGGPSLPLRIRRRVFERLVFARIRANLGDRVGLAVCAGAALGGRLGHFFRGIGLPVLEGYSLTETTGVVSVNLASEHQVGSVGRPLPGTTVRVADDGELLVRGCQVFQGYAASGPNGPDAAEATAQVLADGWLHTGDLGEIDPEGFVRVSGRKHEILVTAGGKTVVPAVLEDQIRLHPLVGQCLVVGDGRPYVAALITLDIEGATAWAQRRGRPTGAVRLSGDPDLRAELQVAVDRANATVSPAEAVRRFEVLPAGWTEDDGYLTPTLRLKRARVLADHRSEVDALYA